MKPKHIPLTIWLILTLLFLVFLTPALGGDGALDPTFSNFTGVGMIPIIRGEADWTTSGTANGNSLICGYFTSFTGSNGTYPLNSIAKLTDTTGTVDTTFSIPVNGEVRGAYLSNSASLTCDIIIWGQFSLTSGSTTYYNLARLTNSGSGYAVDTTFPVIFNQGGVVNSIAVLGTYESSGAVLVGGYNMQPVGGAANTAYSLIGLTYNFSYNSSYGHALSLPGGFVTSITINSSGLPRIFGTLPQGDGSYHWWEALGSDYATVTKSLGSAASSGTNYGPIDGPIFNLAEEGSGPYIIVGVFRNVFGTALTHVAQLNSNLTGLDNTYSFNTNVAAGGGANHGVQQLFINSAGQPILAGMLTSFNGTACGHIVRLNYSGTIGGTVDTTFNSGSGADDRIFHLYQPSGGTGLQIVGAFRNYNGTARGGIASLNIDGSLNTANYANCAANSSTPGTVYAMDTVYTGSQWDIVIGGSFTGVNGKYRENLAYLTTLNGSLDTAYTPTFEGPVKCVRGLNNNQVLVAGNFAQAQGYGCTGLARLNQNGSFDTTFEPFISQANGTGADLHCADADQSVSGDYYIGGIFANVANSSYTLTPSSAFARLNSNGTLDTTFTANISIPSGSGIYVNAGGNAYGGYGMVGYVNVSGNNYGFGAVLNSSGSQQSYVLFNGEVLCATGLSDGCTVMGGNFTQVEYPVSASRGYIAAITPSFTLDSRFAGAGANGPIYALKTEGDNQQGKVLIGGNFSTYNGTAINNLARLSRSGSLDNSFITGTGPNGTVHGINWIHWLNTGLTIGKATVGGAFTTYNGISMPGLAQVQARLGNTTAANFLLLQGD